MNATQITRNDVAQAAAAKGLTIMQAINMVQAACVKLGDESTLSALCVIKSEILFGDE